ncbi:SAV_6107 family HEPN domain-containing protein [Actinomycetospora sp. CA-084318]|uniref:SAV_6107 family HEPN domain-containing protein n=1 Tax=Actinomycetospora sp. CA-084318 TaxID=3239892 RepID=UPI003D994414
MSTPTTCTTGDLFDTGATSAPAPRAGGRPRPAGRAPVAGHRGETRRRSSAAPRPPAPPPSRSVVTLLGAAREGLREAQGASTPAERFRLAHLSALRSAAAVLAVRAVARRSSRPTDAWTLLGSVAPEYGEWAAFFAAHSSTRSAVEAGATRLVGQRDADDMVRQADLFLALVTRTVAGLRTP